jgi:SnoaL-like domain
MPELTSLDRLVAESAIRRVLLDYCRGIDRCDATLVASVYHVDGTDDHGSFVGLGSDFAAYVTARLREHAIATSHVIGSPMIDFRDEATAEVETQVQAWHRCRDDDGEYLESFGGRYFDRFEHRDGAWRIAHRSLTHDWDAVERIVRAFPPDRFAASPRS